MPHPCLPDANAAVADGIGSQRDTADMVTRTGEHPLADPNIVDGIDYGDAKVEDFGAVSRVEDDPVETVMDAGERNP